jgi:hypothetical protein
VSAQRERTRRAAGARFHGRAVASDGRVLVDTVGTVQAHEAQAREYRACRVCAQKRAVEADGRFPEHRIRTTRCPGSAQFTQRWDAAEKRRAVAALNAGWSA